MADWHRELVDLYIPTPLRCNRCQKLGHTKNWCRKTEEVCGQCGGEDHIQRSCQNDAYCVNCRGAHPATSRDCERYKYKCEVLATQAREHITYQEAEEKVRERFVEGGSLLDQW